MATPSSRTILGDLGAEIENFGGLLDTGGTDQSYLNQAAAVS